MYSLSDYLKGKKAEEEFSKLFNDVSVATKEEDIHEHWDVKIEDIGLKVDVKSIKKENRYDILPNENFHWVEVKNVLGKLGWLYGEADVFAFELENYWLIIEKIPLQNFIAEKCKGKKIGNKKDPYLLYRREGRKDVVVKVKTIDLMYLTNLYGKIIKK